MDRSRFKRPGIQTQRQTPKRTFGNPHLVPKAVPSRPRPVGVVMAHTVIAPGSTSRSLNAVQSRPPVPARPAALPQPQVNNVESTQRQRFRSVAAAQLDAPSATVLARRQPIDMALPGEASPWHLGGSIKGMRFKRFRRLAARGAALSLALVITLGGVLFSQGYLKANKVFKGTAGTAAALNANPKPELLKGEGRGRINVLLMGRGGGGHTAPDLTDTMIVASVDPVNHTATLLSVPRDLWVNVPGQGVMKLNSAWQSGHSKHLGRKAAGNTSTPAIQAGYKAVDDTIKEVLGLEIDYHMLVDFKAFKQAVDTVGGVSMTVGADLVDPTVAWENNNDPVLAKAGVQTFDGSKALLYARSRATTSDFDRSDRQRALLLALKDKVATLGTMSNPAKISGLANAFGDNVRTDLSISNAHRLYGILKKVPNTSISSLSLADPNNPLISTGNVNGQSVVLPKAGLFKYEDIHTFLRGQLKDPYILKEKARILILNGTSQAGLATAKSDELTAYGYNVVRIGNTPTSGWTQTTLVDLTKRHKYTRNYLQQRFGQKAAAALGDKTIPTSGADFVIIIGSNETTPAHDQTN